LTKTENNNSSFVFGIVIGAIIGAVVAVYVYKNNKSKVFQDLKKKLEKYFSDFIKETPPAKPRKISVDIPSTVESIDLKPKRIKKSVKLFKK